MNAYWPSLFGGMLIGLAVASLLVLNGRVAGISGIVGRLAQGADVIANGAFVAGLVVGPLLFLVLFGQRPATTFVAGWPVLVASGLLVGFGTRMGSGCTSGHGVLGLARLSPRSFVAVLTFVAAGMVTVAILRWVIS